MEFVAIGRFRPGETSDQAFACGTQVHPFTDSNHAPRLCEGWSAIAKWKGVPLAEIMRRVQPNPEAKYVVFHCMDTDNQGPNYYESIDLIDASHPQTILAYEMNDRALPIEYGAPLRLRVENQLGANTLNTSERSNSLLTSKISKKAKAVTGTTKATSGLPESRFRTRRVSEPVIA